MPINLKKTDVVLIGIGASGGVAALELAKAGIDVIAIEAGQRLSAHDFPSDEIRMNIRGWLGRAKVNHEVPTGRLTAAQTATRPLGATGPMMNGVGGTSIHYATQSWRHEAYEYKVRSTNVDRYGAGSIPAGSTVTDWPVTAAELEPFHDEIEYLLGVSGKAGNIKGKKDERGNIFEASRRREYPLPPLRQTGYAAMLHAAAKRLGYHPFPGPAAIRSRAYKGQPACQYCGFCSGNGCHADAKGSTFLNAIPEAEKTKKLKIVTLARVTQINSDGEGRVTGVTYVKGGDQYFQPASVVLLATYTYENTRLLLLSPSAAYPRGLSNEQPRSGRQALHVAQPVRRERLRRLPPEAEPDDRHIRAGHRLRRSRRRQLRPHRPRVHRRRAASTRAAQPDADRGRARQPAGLIPRWGSVWKEWQSKRTPTRGLGAYAADLARVPYEAELSSTSTR